MSRRNPVQQPPAGPPAGPPAAPAAQPPLVAAVPIFALSPALYDNGVIDYSTTAGQKLYKQGVEKLQEELFDVDSKGIHSFLNALGDRAMVAGWAHILNIPLDISTPNSDLIDLVTQYGEIGLNQICNHVNTYANQQVRAAQDSMQLYHCLMGSLSQEGRNKVTVYKNEYTHLGFPSGALLLKIIIRESYIDTRATVRHLRAKLSALPQYLGTINYDISLFNRYVLDLLQQLSARGETTQDLLANLFEAYKGVNDKDFVSYIKIKENDYDEGKDVSANTLMQLAQQKYKIMVDEKTWAIPSKEEEKIQALEAKLSKLSGKKNPPGNNRSGKQGKSTKKQDGKQNQGRQSNKDKPAWMTKPPPNKDKNKSKKVDNKEYWWCPNHKSWVRHKASECRGVNSSSQQQNNNRNEQQRSSNNTTQNQENSNTDNASSNNRTIRLANALQTIVEDNDE